MEPRGKKLSTTKISEILDKAVEGLSLSKIGLTVHVAHSTVYNVLKDFPLWQYFREHREP